ncbi:MAG: HNH endonuclease [Candidatus Aenigmarchaeota archaeon]|nr:HNH endonuclease [Candidatus Aenigmarchaeota archaeon]
MVNIFVAITDYDWFQYLRSRPDLTSINFWQPGGQTPFKALKPGELFLFKLHAPRNHIVGGGFFSHSTIIPLSLAWDAFGEANGADTLDEMRHRISHYRREPIDRRKDFHIGCRILEAPFFFDESLWINVPKSWSRNIVSGKVYNAENPEGRQLWDEVFVRHQSRQMGFAEEQRPFGRDKDLPRFGEPRLILPRLGQGTFRLVVTDAYERRCAITEEKTLPTLEAAHIKPYSDGGEHEARNGILLRRDIHPLFDRGYVTITRDLRFEVSKCIHQEFENGKNYYALHGRRIRTPGNPALRPDAALLDWHNTEIFMG